MEENDRHKFNPHSKICNYIWSLKCNRGRTSVLAIGSGGGCKSERQAQQIVSKCLEFLKFCCEDEEELSLDIISPNLRFKFVAIQSRTNGNLGMGGGGGGIGYFDAIAQLMDFRKVNGASEVVLRGLSSTETYWKKSVKQFQKWCSCNGQIKSTSTP